MDKINFTDYEGEPMNGANMNKLQENVENEFNNITSVQTGYAVSSNVWSSLETNRYDKYGKMVMFQFTGVTNRDLGVTDELFNSLPIPKTNFRFMVMNTWTRTPARLELTKDGKITNAYTSNMTAGEYQGYVCYIAE